MSTSTGKQLRQSIDDADEADVISLLLVYADWLEERGDPLAAGYRWLAEQERCPIRMTVDTDEFGVFDTLLWQHVAHAPLRGKTNHQLPRAVYDRTLMTSYAWGYGHRSSAYDDAARGYLESLAEGEMESPEQDA